MEELVAISTKMQEYVKMSDELPFPEFSNYYQQVMIFLQEKYQDLNPDQLIEVKGICSIVCSNAHARAAKKDENRKKFQKMQEKGKVWHESNQHQ
ncbi:MAG: hypothetical protein LBB91_00240 [Clostridiales bacterium]|jgi:hypothetical protein|nr:hypothetical protein [Clostridiales bacterium]